MEDLGFESWRSKSFPFSKMSRPAVMPTQSPVFMSMKFSPPTCVNVNKGAIPPLPLYAFMVWTRTFYFYLPHLQSPVHALLETN
jgi:hypothetical protein